MSRSAPFDPGTGRSQSQVAANRPLVRPLASRGLLQRECACWGTPMSDPTNRASPRLGHDFGRISVHASNPTRVRSHSSVDRATPETATGLENEVREQTSAIQKKSLAVSSPNDPDENEADEIARKVVAGQSVEIRGTATAVNRKALASAEASHELHSKLARTKGGGRSLDDSQRLEMESKLRADFSAVRIHINSEAHDLNEQLNARAFAYGRDVYFKRGEFNPKTSQGQELLAHELVHTIQQNRRPLTIQRQAVGGLGEQRKTIPSRAGESKPPQQVTMFSFLDHSTAQVKQEVETLSVWTVTGKLVGTYKPGTTNDYIITLGKDISDGLYLLQFTLKDGTKEVTRVIKGTLGKQAHTIRLRRVFDAKLTLEELKAFDVAKEPKHDASRLSDDKIRATEAYREFSSKSLAKKAEDKNKEALLATRLMLRDVQVTGSIGPYKDYLDQAVRQSGVLAAIETNFNVAGLGTTKTGSFTWKSENTLFEKTDFALWVRDKSSSEPDFKGTTSSNNCFGAIFYGAIKSGFVSKRWVKDFYEYVKVTVIGTTDPTNSEVIENTLKGNNAIYEYDFDHLATTKRPLAGDLVIFQTALKHIVIVTGNTAPDDTPEVISLWDRPNNTYLQVTSIKALVDAGAKRKAIKFFSPVWV